VRLLGATSDAPGPPSTAASGQPSEAQQLIDPTDENILGEAVEYLEGSAGGLNCRAETNQHSASWFVLAHGGL
jgi:hypothetical protein